jgi:hypothetical protein
MNGYQYRVVFTNVVGSVPTSAATLIVEDFTITPTLISQTISAGHWATYTIDMASVQGLTGNVVLTCSGGPPNSMCAVTPKTVMLNGKANATVTLTPAKNVNLGRFTLTFTGSLTPGSLPGIGPPFCERFICPSCVSSVVQGYCDAGHLTM